MQAVSISNFQGGPVTVNHVLYALALTGGHCPGKTTDLTLLGSEHASHQLAGTQRRTNQHALYFDYQECQAA